MVEADGKEKENGKEPKPSRVLVKLVKEQRGRKAEGTGTENQDRNGPENTRTGTDRNATGTRPESEARNGPETHSGPRPGRPERDRNGQNRRTGTRPEHLYFSIRRPRVGPCRRSAPKPFRNVPFSQKPILVRVIRGPRGVLIRARRTTRGQALHGWLDRPVCWTNLSSGLGGI